MLDADRAILWTMLLLALACSLPDTGTPAVVDSSHGAIGTDSADSGTSVDTAIPPLEWCGELVGVASSRGKGEETGTSSAVGPDGARYSIVAFDSGPLTFDAGGPHETALYALDSRDGALARYDAGGAFTWVRQIRSSSAIMVESVAATSDGGAVIVGGFADHIDIAYGAADHLALESAGTFDGFVARFAADGALLWVRQIAGGDVAYATAVTVLSDDTVVIAGVQEGDAVVAWGQPDEKLLEVPTGVAGFVVAFDDTGTLGWARQQPTTLSALVTGLASDPVTNEIVAVGWITEPTVFGPDQPGEIVMYPDSVSGFLARYDRYGILRGAKEIVGGDVESVALAQDGSALVAGVLVGEAIVGPGEEGELHLRTDGNFEAFFARFDAADTPVWAVQSASGPGSDTFAWALAHDGTGGLVATGEFDGVATFGDSVTTASTMVATPQSDLFAVHYDADGALVCALQFEGSGYNAGVGIAALGDGTFEIVDQFAATTTVAARSPEETQVTAAGPFDLLYARIAF
jgi:hypothetical protein